MTASHVELVCPRYQFVVPAWGTSPFFFLTSLAHHSHKKRESAWRTKGNYDVKTVDRGNKAPVTISDDLASSGAGHLQRDP